MKKFEEPKFDIIEFTSQDVIVTSGEGVTIPVEGPPPMGGASNPGEDDEWE